MNPERCPPPAVLSPSVAHGTMTAFASILFEDGFVVEASAEPEFFTDLNLDQIVAAVTAGRDEYELATFFYAPVRDVEAVRYRHQVLSDLEQQEVRAAVREFARAMSTMREQVGLIGTLRQELQKQRWFLQAVASYCAGVGAFAHRLAELELRSPGMTALRDYLQSYTTSEAFVSLASETGEREADLAAVTYGVHIRGTRVRVSRYDGESDMSDEVQRAFAKFAQRAVKDHRRTYREDAHMDHIEEQIAELVARLHPETFTALRDYCDRRRGYLDATIVRFDREVQFYFYLSYLEAIAPLRSLGLAFSHPRVSARSKHEHATQTFDLALAMKLAREGATVVCNDFEVDGPERILVISGPNNGGKTTFARTFGQLHYLAALGLPVPGRDTRPVPARPDLHPLRARGGHRDAAGQVRGRTGAHPRDPVAGDRRQRGDHERELRLDDAARRARRGQRGRRATRRPRRAGGVRHLRRRAGLAGTQHGEHDEHRGPRGPRGAHLPGRAQARRRPGVRVGAV